MTKREEAIVALIEYLHKNAGRTADFPIQLVMKEPEAAKLSRLIQAVNINLGAKAEQLK